MRRNLYIHHHKRTAVLLCSVLALVIGAGAVTVALLSTPTAPVENTFVAAVVDCEVAETVQGNTKANVSIKNTGTVDAYLRATVLINWMNKGTQDGLDHDEFLPTVPVRDTDYTIEYGDTIGTEWIQGADGFWYFTKPVAPGETTDALIDEVVMLTEQKDGYRFTVEIICTAVQSSPDNAVTEAWGSAVTGVNADGSLLVKKWGAAE